ANILHWMAPDIFTSYELNAGTVGIVNVDLDSEPDLRTIQVADESGTRLPFSVEGRTLRFFVGSPGIVRISAGDRGLVYSLTLPQAGDTVWQPSAGKRGIPRSVPPQGGARDIWQGLAVLGGVTLLTEWLLFGAGRRKQPVATASAGRRSALRKAS